MESSFQKTDFCHKTGTRLSLISESHRLINHTETFIKVFLKATLMEKNENLQSTFKIQANLVHIG